MKYLVIVAIAFLSFTNSYAQNVQVANDGLVKVNNKGVFYIKAKNFSAPGQTDYALENLKHKELAYFKLMITYHYDSTTRSHFEIQYYILIFDNTGGSCDVRNYHNSNTIVKSLARLVLGAHLVDGDHIDEQAEKDFILSYNGFLSPEAVDSSDKTKLLSSGDSATGSITIKENVVYYNTTVAGTFTKTAIDSDMQLVMVYATNKAKVAEVTYIKGQPYWSVVTVMDEERNTTPYDKEKPIESLFRYLIGKKYL